MVAVTASLHDLGVAGLVTKAGVTIEFALLRPIVTTGDVVSVEPVIVPFVAGLASLVLPPSPVGNAYRVYVCGGGAQLAWCVVIPDVPSITLGTLILSHQLDPTTMTVTPADSVWSVSLAAEANARATADNVLTASVALKSDSTALTAEVVRATAAEATKADAAATTTALNLKASTTALTAEETLRANADNVRVAVDAVQTFTDLQRAQGRANLAASGQSDLKLNVRDFGAVGDGVTNDSAAIQAAWNTGGTGTTRRPLYFPSGTYLYDAAPLTGSRANWYLEGEDKANTTIKLGASATWLIDESATNWVTFNVRNLTFDCNDKAGAFRNTRSVVNVTRPKIVDNCVFVNYSVCAISSDSPDEPYWNISRNSFNPGAANNMTAISVCLMGSADGGNISGNVFIRGRIQLKLGRAATVKVRHNDFVPYTNGDGTVPRANIFIVSGSAVPPGALIEGNKFGNEGITATDYHIVIADELAGTFGGDKHPNFATDSTNTLQGLMVVNNVVGGGTGANPPIVYSTTPNVTDAVVMGNVTVGTSPDYLVQFRTAAVASRSNQGSVVIGGTGGGGTDTLPPLVSNSFGWASVSDFRGVGADPQNPQAYAGGADAGAYTSLLAAAPTFAMASATTAGTTDAVGGTDAVEITYSASGSYYASVVVANLKPGVPAWIEFDVILGDVSPLTSIDFRLQESSAGIRHFGRLVRPTSIWRRKRFLFIPRSVPASIRFTFISSGAGSIKIGRPHAYHADEPVSSGILYPRAITRTTAVTAGAAAALPATPAGYVEARINGVQRWIPYY